MLAITRGYVPWLPHIFSIANISGHHWSPVQLHGVSWSRPLGFGRTRWESTQPRHREYWIASERIMFLAIWQSQPVWDSERTLQFSMETLMTGVHLDIFGSSFWSGPQFLVGLVILYPIIPSLIFVPHDRPGGRQDPHILHILAHYPCSWQIWSPGPSPDSRGPMFLLFRVKNQLPKYIYTYIYRYRYR